MTASVPAPRSRDLTIGIAIVCAIVYAFFIHSRAYSSNDASRLATIESLVERGTWMIDESSFATVDRIKVGDHFYSDKPPILSFAGAGVYAVLHGVFGLTLQSYGCAPERMPTWCLASLESGEADWVYFIITFLLVSLPAALMLVLIYRLARHYGAGNIGSVMFVAGLSIGTAIFPYSAVLNNHVPAAASTLVAFYLLMTSDRPSRVRLAMAGCAAALAATIDLVTAIFTVALMIYIAVRYRSSGMWFALGGVIPIAITIVLDYQITGSPLLPYLYPQGYAYTGSELYTTLGGTRHAADVPRYAFDLLIGERGFLMFYPIVVWYIYAAGRALRSRDKTIRSLAWTIGVSSAVYLLYIIFNTDNFGGYSYSPRWLLNPVPLLAMFAAIDRSWVQTRWRIGVMGVAAIVSIVQAFYGALNPWSPAFPLWHIETTAPQPSHPPAVAVSGYSNFNDVPAAVRQLLGANNIVPRKFDARRGIVILSEPTWYFIDESTPLAPELAGPLGLGMRATYALNVDLTPLAQEWLKTFDVAAPQPAMFGGEISLLGYKLQTTRDNISVITAWQNAVQHMDSDQRRIAVEMAASDGTLVQHTEAMAARYSSLQPGDVLFQVQTVSLTNLSAGKYQLQIGVWNPDAEVWLPLPDRSERLPLTSITK